jgi:hypothetical protein
LRATGKSSIDKVMDELRELSARGQFDLPVKQEDDYVASWSSFK